MKKLIYILLTLVIFSACQPKEEADVLHLYYGSWKVKSVIKENHDSTGLISTKEISELGILQIRRDTSWCDCMHDIVIDSAIRNNVKPFKNMTQMGVLDVFSNNEYRCYLGVEPEAKRFYLEGVVGAITGIQELNLERNGNSMTWTHYEADGPAHASLTYKETIVLVKQ